MNWYIGQKIVAVRDHAGGLKKGQIFTIKALKTSPCMCNHIIIDVGIRLYGKGLCNSCNKYTEVGDIYWFSYNNFAPLDEMTAHESAIKELLKENEIYETI